jgi:PhnB protein
MSTEKKHIRNGMGAVRPYLFGRLDLLDFVKDVFGAVEVERNSVSGGFHVKARIGDSVVVMAAMDPPYSAATKASTYVYVDDVDAVYARAIAAGAVAVAGPAGEVTALSFAVTVSSWDASDIPRWRASTGSRRRISGRRR